MKRVIEKLAHERKQKENEFLRKLKELKEKTQNFLAPQQLSSDQALTSRLEGPGRDDSEEILLTQHLLPILAGFQNTLEKNLEQMKDVLLSSLDLIELNTQLTDAKNKEWDALGSNHVGMIFKSMEWRIDKLAAEYEDVKILMKKFILLKEKLNALLSTLEKEKMPAPAQVKELLEPLEDWRYAGFENRFRGYEEEVKAQQAEYLKYFEQAHGKRIIDLGCGRGEFLELLTEKGLEAEGIDLNSEMVETCRDKGLRCLKGDLLEKLVDYEDNSLGGIFCSQVVEHLPPLYLKRLIELSYFKLAPSSYLLLETVNPTSVFSLVQVYFLDISHQTPVHPQALKFLLESSGFEKVEMQFSAPLEKERLQELPGADEIATTVNQNIDKLNKLLYAPANYAVIGQKS